MTSSVGLSLKAGQTGGNDSFNSATDTEKTGLIKGNAVLTELRACKARCEEVRLGQLCFLHWIPLFKAL